MMIRTIMLRSYTIIKISKQNLADLIPFVVVILQFTGAIVALWLAKVLFPNVVVLVEVVVGTGVVGTDVVGTDVAVLVVVGPAVVGAVVVEAVVVWPGVVAPGVVGTSVVVALPCPVMLKRYSNEYQEYSMVRK